VCTLVGYAGGKSIAAERLLRRCLALRGAASCAAGPFCLHLYVRRKESCYSNVRLVRVVWKRVVRRDGALNLCARCCRVQGADYVDEEDALPPWAGQDKKKIAQVGDFKHGVCARRWRPGAAAPG